ncbi:HPr-rel-A system PqqD family peptide chaperone [Alterisphingorhabdus coralli]|uniref:HPr-rel-A system PqqD family peptide chaperone n=1 Tax=Alterisphingorhabdus coralli TaxID=3071408 RepID=A0AA97F4L9_9SPHN|nr:HPr-rel-A system PqqD family peptide chaperone [Parasphingorhabdus sp. SCSIO 66989]WOE74234.1 HPr-rel-A system PqqD family peptide chaperone [Parasphingorhabdus sp. SCSIO 66989]
MAKAPLLDETFLTDRYILDPADQWRRKTLDEMQVLYHRPSGQTHVLIEPVPQIIDAMLQGAETAEQVMTALNAQYDLQPEDDEPEAENEDDLTRLTARLDEMVALGFVRREVREQGDKDAL